jgi:hypothetical protein
LTSQLVSRITRIGELATTDAVRSPRSSTPISPNTSPGPRLRMVRPSRTTSAVPDSMAMISLL